MASGQASASAAMVTFEDTAAAAAAAASSSALESPPYDALATNSSLLQPETLNIPAVLWDRPSGSSKRVPPPVPPRSPKRPYDHVASFGAATAAATEAGRGDLRAYTSSVEFFSTSMPILPF